MDFPPVSPEEMRASQLLTGFVMAAFVGAAFFPRHAVRIRAVTLGLYLAGIAALIIVYLLRVR
jgi:hypothetical protein